MPRIRANFFSGTLSVSMAPSDTTLNAAALASFPTVASPNTASLTLNPHGANPEIVLVTSHSPGATSATVTRAQEGTTALSWPVGTTVECDVVVSDFTDSIRIPDSGGTFDLFRVQKGALPASPNDGVVVITDSSDAAGFHSIFIIYDKFGNPVAWCRNDGGWLVTDAITQLQGSSLLPNITLGYLSQSTKAGPALIFGHSGAGGGTVTAGGSSVTVDVFKDNWLRLTDDAALQWSKIFRTGWTGGITNTGEVGPGGEPGFAATNVLGTGTTTWYRASASNWRTAASVTVDGALNAGLFKVKAADTSRTSTAALADDPDLVVPVVANATYAIRGYFVYEGSTAGDFSFDLTKPAGATLSFNAVGLGNTQTSAIGSPNFNVRTGGTALSLGGVGAGSRVAAHLDGIVTVGGTAGNLTLQWCQTVSDATATILGAGSFLRLERVA